MSNLNIRKVLGNNIKFYRLKMGLSQEELAEILGTTPVYLSVLENGKRNMRIDYIAHIANCLDIKVKELFVERKVIKNTRRPRKKKK